MPNTFHFFPFWGEETVQIPEMGDLAEVVVGRRTLEDDSEEEVYQRHICQELVFGDAEAIDDTFTMVINQSFGGFLVVGRFVFVVFYFLGLAHWLEQNKPRKPR